MSDLFGNHIVGFPTRRLICVYYYIFSFAIKEILLETERGKQRAKDYGSLAWYWLIDYL